MLTLQAAAVKLSQYFQEDAYAGQQMLSNAIMTQAPRMNEVRGRRGAADQPGTIDLGPEVGGGEKAEDLFVFSVKHVRTNRGLGRRVK